MFGWCLTVQDGTGQFGLGRVKSSQDMSSQFGTGQIGSEFKPKFFGPKIFVDQNFLDSTKIILDHKFFLDQKLFWTKKCKHKICWTLHFSDANFLDPKFCWIRIL